jgi:hypothetical protein
MTDKELAKADIPALVVEIRRLRTALRYVAEGCHGDIELPNGTTERAYIWAKRVLDHDDC